MLPQRSITVLHISDLHVPAKALTRTGELNHDGWNRLWDYWRTRSNGSLVDLCWLTGDLTDHPNEKVARAIFSELQRYARDYVVVPGNHDRRLWGNFGVDMTTFESASGGWV